MRGEDARDPNRGDDARDTREGDEGTDRGDVGAEKGDCEIGVSARGDVGME